MIAPVGENSAVRGMADGHTFRPGPVSSRSVRRLDDDRHLAEAVRVVLAVVAGLLMLDTSAAVRVPLALGVMAFSLYAGGLLWLAVRGYANRVARVDCWLDAGWFIGLIALSGDAGGRYFLFLFFPVLFASWRHGVGESVLLAVSSNAAAVLVLLIGMPEIPWPNLLSLPLALLVTGPLAAILARAEAGIHRVYAFSADLVESLDPRHGLDALLPEVIERIAGEFQAASALLILRSFESGARVLCWEQGEGVSRLSEKAALPVLEHLALLPQALAFSWHPPRHCWQRGHLESLLPGEASAAPASFDQARIPALAQLLDQSCLMSVPLECRGAGSLRLVLGSRAGGLRAHALDMLVHVADQLAPILENALLLEQLASEAVEGERARIGRDLHDSAVQPYIGLKFAIEALARAAAPDNPLYEDLQRLQQMAGDELATMREVISGLRGTPGRAGVLLASAVQRQAERFSQLFGIEVQVDIDGALPVNRRVAGELFHMVAEGLANIRRHTRSRRAAIALSCQEGMLLLRIRNEHAEPVVAHGFSPRSLSERAAALGGSTQVDADQHGSTVLVSIPLE